MFTSLKGVRDISSNRYSCRSMEVTAMRLRWALPSRSRPNQSAHVSAIFAGSPQFAARHADDRFSFPDVVTEIAKSAKQVADEAARTAHRRFTTAAIEPTYQSPTDPNVTGISASFREAEGFFFECVSQAAKYADLVVFGPLKSEEFQTSAGFADVLMTAKRPVLLSPKPVIQSPCKVAIGWDGGHAAHGPYARADRC